MNLGTLLLIVLILILVGALPTWPHSQSYGWSPAAVLIVIILLLLIFRR
jgi:hypothetical protein